MDENTAAAFGDDLSREVYCILGIPVDAIAMSTVLRSVNAAAANRAPFVISTPNLNFLVNSQTDAEFRESLLLSDLCPADGMPIVWIARLMGVPIKTRVAGSDIFEMLKSRPSSGHPLKVFLFGATEHVAAAAAERINQYAVNLSCVGWLCPGFGTVDEMSQGHVIDRINSSNADFLVAALGARKGQLWLLQNHSRLRVPIRAHLGAVVNFQAGSVRRAPYTVQKLGLEWLWRIKEEPSLFRRYWHDGCVLLRLLLTRVLPLAVRLRWLRLRADAGRQDFVIVAMQKDKEVMVRLSGYATAARVPDAIGCFREAIASRKPVVVDLSRTRALDTRFLGLFLMLRKQLKARGLALQLIDAPSALQRQLRLNGLGYLLSPCGHYDIRAVP